MAAPKTIDWRVFDPARVRFESVKNKEFINVSYASDIAGPGGSIPVVISMPVARVAFAPNEYKPGDADKGALTCSISFVGADPWMRNPAYPTDDTEFADLRAFLPKMVALQAAFRAHLALHQAALVPKFDEAGNPVTRLAEAIEMRPLIKLSKSKNKDGVKVPDGANPPTMSAKVYFAGDRGTGIFDGMNNNARRLFNKTSLGTVLPMGTRVRTTMELTGVTYKDNVPGLAFAFKTMQIVPAKANSVCPFAPVAEETPAAPAAPGWGGGSSLMI